MIKVIGIDPGTRTWDFVCLEGGNLIFDKTIPTEKIRKEPELVIEIIKKFNPDSVNAPSGYGLPLKKIADLTDDDLFQMVLKKGDMVNVGLTKVLKLMIKNEVPAVVFPGVKHLPTVPDYRKVNKIDMGTPDKVCTAALGISKYNDYEDASFILAELGSAFNAYVAVERGKIIDGLGGSLASSGFRASGKLDGEIAYLYEIEKETLFKGGFLDIDDMRISSDYFIEGVVKDIASIASVIDTKTILLSKSKEVGEGVPEVNSDLKERINMNIKELNGCAKVSNAAQGAAIIMDGLMGGKHKALADHLEIKNSYGSVFDYIFL